MPTTSMAITSTPVDIGDAANLNLSVGSTYFIQNIGAASVSIAMLTAAPTDNLGSIGHVLRAHEGHRFTLIAATDTAYAWTIGSRGSRIVATRVS